MLKTINYRPKNKARMKMRVKDYVIHSDKVEITQLKNWKEKGTGRGKK